MKLKSLQTLSISLAVLSGAFLISNSVIAASTGTPEQLNKTASSSAVFYENVPILMYHYIEAPTAKTIMPALYLDPKIFASQLQELRRYHTNPVYVSEVAASLREKKPLPQYSMALTFDDGYQDFYTNAFPLLKKYQMKATIYIIINKLDKKDYLTTPELKEIAASGLVQIGSHTFNHPDLRTLKDKDAKFEIANSKINLERLLNQSVPTFAYPFGDYLPKLLPVVQAIGYTGAVSVNPGGVQSSDNLWLMKRVRANNRAGQDFAKWLFGWFKAKY